MKFTCGGQIYLGVSTNLHFSMIKGTRIINAVFPLSIVGLSLATWCSLVELAHRALTRGLGGAELGGGGAREGQCDRPVQ